MPELPEVETIKNGLAPKLIGRIIQSVHFRTKQLRYPLDQTWAQSLVGQRIDDVSRRAKYLLANIGKGGIIWHLGMSGSLRLNAPTSHYRHHDHVAITFDDNQQLIFNDPRRFGLFAVTDDIAEYSLLKQLGQEPLAHDFTGTYLHQAAKRRRLAIKTFLMTNAIVVGVGNIYASEALFHAKLSPLLPANALSIDQCCKLVSKIKTTLRCAISAGGTSLHDFVHIDGSLGYFQKQLFVYGREGQPCRLCQTPITATTCNQRSTFYCPTCQA